MSANDLTYGFHSTDNGSYYYYADKSTWCAMINGYNNLFRAGLSALLSFGLDEKEADNFARLHDNFEEIEEGLNSPKD